MAFLVFGFALTGFVEREIGGSVDEVAAGALSFPVTSSTSAALAWFNLSSWLRNRVSNCSLSRWRPDENRANKPDASFEDEDAMAS
jgi:hypothetical protein